MSSPNNVILKDHQSQQAEWIKASGRTVALSLILVGMGWGFLIVSGAIPGYYWEIGLISFGSVVAYFLLMSIAGRLLRDAYLYHLLYSLGVLLIIIPLLTAARRLLESGGMSSDTTLSIVILGCVLLFSQEARSTWHGLRESVKQNWKAGRLGEESHEWDLSSDLYIHGKNVNDRDTELRWWRLLSPFLPGLGFAISRNLPDNSLSLFSAYLLLFLALMLSINYARQFGIALYLRGVARKD